MARITKRTRHNDDLHTTKAKKTRLKKPKSRSRIFTIGHSNRTLTEFIEVLESQKLKLVVDVRSIPKSRHNPQYWGTRLAKSLAKKDIQYILLPELGGLRRTRPDSKNKAWRNTSFRGYADYMQTEEFDKGLRKLISLSKRKRLTIMCAEAVPWRCHRSLIADALLAQGFSVEDLFSKTNVRPHKMTSFAKVRKGKVTYPAT